MNKLQLQERITEANLAYRKGNAIIEDFEYDALVDQYIELFGEDDFISQVGFIDAFDERMEELPIVMGSMNKIKTIDEYRKWLNSKNIPGKTLMVLTPKLDGLSFCTDEYLKKAWTRGNGIQGQRSDDYYRMIGVSEGKDKVYCYGEVIMKRSLFELKYSEEFTNARNMVAGLLNHKTPQPALVDCDYIRYGVEMYDGTQMDKVDQLEFCNRLNKVKIPYITCYAEDITIELLTELFKKWSKDYDIDGIVIDVNSNLIRLSIGREASKLNPGYARAFKGNFEQVVETVVKNIVYNVSKSGKLVPVCQVEPVNCDGAVVSNISLYNARTVVNLGIASGARIKIKRSGMVIPKVVEVLTPMEVELPVVCPECGHELVWNETDIDLMCINLECPATAIKKLYAFFKIIDAENFSEGTIDAFVAAGYDSVKKILAMSIEDMIKIDRVGEKKARKIYRGIHSKLNGISLPVLQHASGFFQGLGVKKLALVEDALQVFDFLNYSKNPLYELEKIEGFSNKSAQIYMNGIYRFNEWVKDLPCVIAKPVQQVKVVTGNKFVNQVVVFTGFRDKELENRIISEGGKIVNKVSKKTTLLITKNKGSGSSKEQDAIAMGIKIIDRDELKKMLN